jgi:hypothetical protein
MQNDPQFEHRQKRITIAIYLFTVVVLVVSIVGLIWGRELGIGGQSPRGQRIEGVSPTLIFITVGVFILFIVISHFRAPRI